MSVSYREIINDFNQTKDIKSLIDSNDDKKNIIGNVINKVFNILKREEKVILLVPITNEKNNSRFSDGSFGWYVASKKEAIDYSRVFKDTIGNRLLVFTNRRMIFMNLIRFIDTYEYNNYKYSDINNIKIKSISNGDDDFTTVYFSKKDESFFMENLYADDGKKVEYILNNFISYNLKDST